MALQSTNCKIFFLILSVSVYSIVAQYNCNDFASESWRNFTINETFEGILESVLISDIKDAEIQTSTHLQASVNADKLLTISVKTNFEDHDEDIDATAKLVIDCANNAYTINYDLNIGREACTDLNFSSDYYTYIVYDGLPQDYEFDLNDFERISIRCARNSIKFDIEENDYFDLHIAEDQGPNGEYYASIRTKKRITAPFKQLFNITAVDTEDPENVATTFLEVEIAESEEMYFAESYYWGVIYRDLKIIISNGPIVLDALSDLNVLEILSDYGDFFDVEVSLDEIHLVVSPQRKYEELNDTSVMIILKAHDPYYEYTAETIVMLNVSSEILTPIVPIVEDISTTSAPQDENNEEAGDGENRETNDEGDEGDDSQQINDDNVDIDSQEDNKQTDDKGNDSQQNDDEDEDQKVDVEDDDDQKIDDNDEDKQIDDYDEDHDAADQKGGDDDEDQKNDGDEDDDYNDDDGLVLEGGDKDNDSQRNDDEDKDQKVDVNAGDDDQKVDDNDEDIDNQENSKQTNDKDNDSQRNDDEDEDQKVDVNDGDDDQKVDDNDEDSQIDNYDEDYDPDYQKGGDDDEDQKSYNDEDDDYNYDDGLVLEDGVVNIDVHLTGLDYWIVRTRAVTIIIVVICSFIIVSSIIYLRSRTPRREIYMYESI